MSTEAWMRRHIARVYGMNWRDRLRLWWERVRGRKSVERLQIELVNDRLGKVW